MRAASHLDPGIAGRAPVTAEDPRKSPRKTFGTVRRMSGLRALTFCLPASSAQPGAVGYAVAHWTRPPESQVLMGGQLGRHPLFHTTASTPSGSCTELRLHYWVHLSGSTSTSLGPRQFVPSTGSTSVRSHHWVHVPLGPHRWEHAASFTPLGSTALCPHPGHACTRIHQYSILVMIILVHA